MPVEANDGCASATPRASALKENRSSTVAQTLPARASGSAEIERVQRRQSETRTVSSRTMKK
jgi:hypothetical protein